ncbi:hypothetical protein ABPG74_015395 [Tetrahymena malaccensis]
MSVFFKIFIVFLYLERLINALSSYIPSKQVQINQVYALQYGDGQLSADIDQYIITQVTFAQPFNRVPQVLLATFDQDLDGTKILNSNWQLLTQGISQTGFSSKLIKKGLQHIYTLGYYYLAIDSNDVYIFSNQVANFKANAIVVNGNKLVCTIKIQYQRAVDTSKTKRIMTAFYTGYDQTTTNNSQAKLSIFLEITQFQDYAQLTITSEQTNNFMEIVYYNYMEYYEDLDQNLFVVEYLEERQFYTVPANSILSGNQVDRLQSVSPFYTNIGSIQGILCGFSGFQIPPKNEVLRLTIQNINFSNNQFNYQYETWQDTEIQGTTSNVLVFKQLNCNIYFNFQCVDSCPSHYFMYYDQVKVTNLCQKCYALCSECVGSKYNQCTKCYPGFIFSNGSCICPQNQIIMSDNSCGCSENYELVSGKCQEKTYFNGNTLELLNKSADGMSKTAIAVTGILTMLSGFTKERNSAIVYLFSVQKVLYLLLVNIGIPYFFQVFLEILTQNRIFDKFNAFNPFQMLGDEKELYIYVSKFEQEKIISSILINCGGALVIFLFTLALNITFQYSQKLSKRQIFLSIYEKVIVSFLSTNLILLVPIFSFGLYLQMSHFFDFGYSRLYYLKIFFVLIVHGLIIFLLHYIMKYLSTPDHTFCFQIEQCPHMFDNILREKLQNGCIKQSFYRKIYMEIYVIFEGYIFPLAAIAGRTNFKSQIITFMIIQIIETIITTILRPFQSRLDNFQYCLEQMLWSLVFILYSILSFQLNNTSLDLVYQNSSINAIILAIVILIFIIIGMNPLISLIKFGLFVQMRYKEYQAQKQKQSSNLRSNTSMTVEMLQKSFKKTQSILQKNQENKQQLKQ